MDRPSEDAVTMGFPCLGLDISNTGVSDLTPIRRAHECRSLNLRGSQVSDIGAIIDTGSHQADHRYSQESLDFRDTPASRIDARFAELAALADESSPKCFFETKAYLRELAKPSSPPEARGMWRAFIARLRSPPRS